MNHRDSARRAASQQQLLFDWSAEERVPADQPLAPVSNAGSQLPPPSPVAPFPAPTATPDSSAHQIRYHGYGPGHPWHYLPDGDNAPPVPFDDIPPAEDYGRSLDRELPRPAAKRIIKARTLLADERRDLEQARVRYEDVIARGAEALSRYDRDIAYGGNEELARAGTLALLYSQISWRRGRIAYLEQLASPDFTRSK